MMGAEPGRPNELSPITRIGTAHVRPVQSAAGRSFVEPGSPWQNPFVESAPTSVLLCEIPQGGTGRPSKSLTLRQAEALLDAAAPSAMHAYVVLIADRRTHRGTTGAHLIAR
jgi:hypothetical protein